MDNEKLKRKFIRGNKKAFDIIYNDFSSAMYSICLRYTKNTDEAADMLQDAFIKIYEKRKTFNPEFELASWIKRIVINTAIDHYTKNKKTTLIEDDTYFEAEDQTEANTESFENIKISLIDALQHLPDGYRTVFNLYVMDNLTHQEIADYLEISINTSKSQLSRARKILKLRLQETNIAKDNITNA